MIKRICESGWHREVELRKHERCPLCRSRSYHLVIDDAVYVGGWEY